MPERPNVFPSGTNKSNAASTKKAEEVESITPPPAIDAEYAQKRLETAEEVYSSSLNETGYDAIKAMAERTAEQIKRRDEALNKNEVNTENYQKLMTTATQRSPTKVAEIEKPQQKVTLAKEIKSPVNNLNVSNLSLGKTNAEDYIQQISQPQFNMAFDVIPLPSEGKLYPSKKSSVRVAYMNAADENILTSPNVVQSGEFLEILINRKLLENIRYKDLHVGDRNAIMIWLRATSYGEMYPVTLFDNNDEIFETEINLNNLKIKNLGAEPDSEGLFDITLPSSKHSVKFRLLTVGDLEEIEKLKDADKQYAEEKKIPLINKTNTYILERQIIEANGNRDTNYVLDYVQRMRIPDSDAFKKYVDSIESGVDLNLRVGTPGGEFIETFLPLNFKFFWPNVKL